MTDGHAWEAEGLRAKASLYFERAFAAENEEDAEPFAFWMHVGLELLQRAAVAKVNPALLSTSNEPASLLYGLGLEPDADPLSLSSTPTATVTSLCERFVEDFGKGEAAVCHEARRRRNAELHTATAAMNDLESGWRGRFFATCRVLAQHLGANMEELFGEDAAALAERLIADDAESVRKKTRAAINAAAKRAAKLTAEQRAEREAEARLELLDPRGNPLGLASGGRSSGKPRVLREATCPGCETTVALRGEVVRPGTPRIDGAGELVQSDIALPTQLECPVCELRLSGLAELTDAGFGDPVHLREYPDPVDAFDVDLSDYHDSFVQMLAEDDAYQDE